MRLTKQIISSTLLITAIIAFFPAATLAQNITDQMGSAIGSFTALPGGDEGSLEIVAGRVIAIFFSIFGIVFFALMVYGGYKWMIAQGREEEVHKAQSIIRSAIIGICIVLIAYAISVFVVGRLLTATTTGAGT